MLDDRALREGHIVLVRAQYLVGILFCRLLNHVEKRRFHLLSVDDEHAAEYLVAAVLRVNLGEAEYLGVGQRPSQLLLYLVKVLYFLGRQGQTFLLVVLLKVVNVLNRLGLVVDGEHRLIQSFVHALQHGVVVGVLRVYGEILLYARNTLQIHVLGYLHGVRAPRRYHLAARAYEVTVDTVDIHQCGVSVQPAQFLDFFLRKLMVNFGRYHAFRRGLEKKNHTLSCFVFIVCTRLL